MRALRLRVGPMLALPWLLALAPQELLAAETAERALTPEEIAAWLDARALPKGDSAAKEDADAPPPAPRHHGFSLETTVGVMSHLGHMKNVSPLAPRFALRFGYEPLRWLLVFVEGDLSLASTGYAHPPPPARSYAYFGLGGGARGTVALGESFGASLQGSVGGARASEDVLRVYGYEQADSLSLYLAGELGLEWYPVNPHLSVALHGGVRHYSGLERERGSEPPLAWVSGAGLRYTF